MNEKPDWVKIRNEYVSGNISYRKLAEKYNISFATLRSCAERENWTEQRKIQQHKISTKSAQKIENEIVLSETERIKRIINVTDLLLEKIELAASHIKDNKNSKDIKQLTSALKDIRDIQIVKDKDKETESPNISINIMAASPDDMEEEDEC